MATVVDITDSELISKIEDKINQSITVLSSLFQDRASEDSPDERFDVSKYFDQNSTREAYEVFLKDLSMFSELTQNQSAIRKMRSSYLPVDFFKDTDGLLNEVLTDGISLFESYENTFMRMLGMPQLDRLSDETEVFFINQAGELVTGTYAEMFSTIIQERQLTKNQRRVRVNNKYFNIEKSTFEEEEELTQNNIDIEYVPDLTDIPEAILKFSYLLIPPVQDHRISKCINEPDKIVKPLFDDSNFRLINGNKPRPSLLESIMRIRLDRISGTVSGLTNSSNQISFNDEDLELDEDSFGVIESLFILRLSTALSSIANKLNKHLDQAQTNIREIGYIPSSEEQGDKNTRNDGAAANPLQADVQKSPEEEKLENQRLIEDAVMSLVNDDSKVLDLQVGIYRNSSVSDAHFSSSIISIVDVPRKVINQRLLEIKKRKEEIFASRQDRLRSEISGMLGIDIGVGVIDTLAFALSFFLISEEGMLGLLSDKEFDLLLSSDVGLKLARLNNNDVPDRKSFIDSINELTQVVYSVYKYFEYSLQSDAGVDTSGNNIG